MAATVPVVIGDLPEKKTIKVTNFIILGLGNRVRVSFRLICSNAMTGGAIWRLTSCQ